MISTSDFRNGMGIEVDGKLYSIVYFQHVKPGKGGAFVRTKLKSIIDGAVIDKTFRAGEKFNQVVLEEKEVQYLYESDDLYYFMDTETYEQEPLTGEQLGEALGFLKENLVITIQKHQSAPIGVLLPTFVELEVTKADPGLRGDTQSGGSKPATLETGMGIQVPLFINVGDVVKVDTRTRQYVERVG